MSNQPEINVDIPEINVKAVEGMLDRLFDNIVSMAQSPTTWIPLIIIVAALVMAGLTRRALRPHLIRMIEKFKVSYRMHNILRNITKLCFQATALILILIAEAIWRIIVPDADITVLTAASKLLLAWILIRILAQVIENNLVRQIVAMTGWIIASLSILGVMPEAKAALDAVGMDFGDWRLSLLTLIKFTIAIVILLTGTGLLTNVAERSLQRATDITPSARVLLIKIIKVTLISLAILIGVTSAGIDLSALAIFGGALGLGIGFGLQKVISNLFSGMILLVDKSIKPGDIIEMRDGSGVFGWVNQLSARYVSIITRDNKEYLIPNEDFITQPVINWSYTDRKIRVETKFGIDYASDPHLVKKIAVESTMQVKRICADPKPVCHLVEFGDSSLNFVLRYWIEDAENGVTNTKGDVMLALWDTLKENDIQIPFPHRVIIQKD